MFDPTAIVLADKATKHHVKSALPEAPIRSDRPPRRWSVPAFRRTATDVLRGLADRVKPRRMGTCQTSG